MANVITVQVQGSSMFKDLADRFPGSMARAVNRTADKTRTIVSKRIREVFHVKAEALRTTSRGKGVIYVGRKATAQAPAAIVRISDQHISFSKFPVKWRRSMPGAEVDYRSGRRHQIRKSFVRMMRSGHRGVFLRPGRARLPIVELTGPSAAKMFIDREVNSDVEKEIASELEKEIDTAVRDIYRGYGR